MLTHNKMKIIQLLKTSTMTMTQLDMKTDMDIPMSNTLINTLDNHYQWPLMNRVIMLTKCHTLSQ